MATIVGMLRKALPHATLKRATGRGQVWWYAKSKTSGDYLRGRRSSLSVINKLKANFEGWRASAYEDGMYYSRYSFVIRDDKGVVLGVAALHEYYADDAGACVLLDEHPMIEESLPAYHSFFKKNKKLKYEKVS